VVPGQKEDLETYEQERILKMKVNIDEDLIVMLIGKNMVGEK